MVCTKNPLNDPPPIVTENKRKQISMSVHEITCATVSQCVMGTTKSIIPM